MAALGTIAWTTVVGKLRNAGAAVVAGRQPTVSPAQLTVLERIDRGGSVGRGERYRLGGTGVTGTPIARRQASSRWRRAGDEQVMACSDIDRRG